MTTASVSIDFLRGIANRLFDYLESSGSRSVQLEKDFYWAVSERDRYNPYQEPTGLLLGQLYDDLETLKKLEAGELEPIRYHFTLLAAILTYIGDNQGSIEK